MKEIFCRIRADIAKDFTRSFPDHYDFVGMLRRVSDDVGVRVIKKPGLYQLEGHWLPIGQVHEMLNRTLDAYKASVTLHNGSSNQSDFNDRQNLDTPTLTNNLCAKVATKASLYIKTAHGELGQDEEDCDEESHEYSSLKTTISDICTSLSKDDESVNVDRQNDEINKERLLYGDEDYKCSSLTDENNSGNENNINSLKERKTLPPRKKSAKKTHKRKASYQKELSESLEKRTITFEKCYVLVNKDSCGIEDTSKKNFQVYQCVNCNFTHESNKAVREHFSRIHRAKPTKCDICHKLFPSERYAKRHSRLVHRDTQYCCDICGKTYKTLRTLEDHLKSHDNGYIKPDFPCDICKKTFSSQYILKCHISSVHNRENRTYLCPVCGKNFTTKHSLNMHQNIHSGNRPFTCNICGKCFMYNSALRDHKHIHSGEKKFECEVCNKAFQQRSGLQMHAKIHTEKKAYHCKECGRGFVQKQSLQRHERSHKGEKPFFCKICGRFFGDSGIIRRHLIMVHKINKDTKSWREDIIEKGREDIAEESVEKVNFGSDDVKDSVQKKTESNLPQKLKIIERVDKDTHQSSNSQEDDVVVPEDTCTLEPIPVSKTILALSTSTLSSSPNILASEPTYLPDTQTFITSDYCRSLPLPTQFPPLGTCTGVDVSPYSLHSHQHSTYLNQLPSSHLDPSRYPYPCSQQSVGIAADARYTLSQTESLGLPRVDSVLNKCLHDMEPPENLSISSLYAYYTSLASQYLSSSQYHGYGGTEGGSESVSPEQV